jgi:hypothetical protein
VATQQLLDAYTFLTRESVYLQSATETEVDAMLRLLNSTVQDTWKARDALLEVRSAVNCRAQQAIHKVLASKGLTPDASSSMGVSGLCRVPAARGGGGNSSNATIGKEAKTPATPTSYRRLMAAYQ